MKDAYVIKAIGVVLAISIVFGSLFVSLNQVLRESANDPQVQLAEDTAIALNNDISPSVLDENVDVSSSLAPFVMVFNEQFQPVNASGGVVDGTPIAPPQGVFEYAKDNGTHAFTWQPTNDLSFAAVVTPYEDGYVLSARSLREVSSRQKQILSICVIGWILTIGVSLGTLAAVTVVRKTKTRK